MIIKMKVDFRPSDKNLNLRLIQDLEIKLGAYDLVRWLDDEAERLSVLGIVNDYWNIDFTPALLLQRNIAEIRAAELSSEAHLVVNEYDRYEIRYKRGLPDYAPYFPRRFAIAHEIGHTYWFEKNTCQPLSLIQRNVGTDSTIEILCNRFAASLLLPKKRLLTALSFVMRGRINCPLPLFAIPTLSEYFKVAERAVAQRLFFFLRPSLKAIICVRSESVDQPLISEGIDSKAWTTSWCALPSHLSERRFESETRIPFLAKKRIPDDMVPNVPFEQVHELELDSRWWKGIFPTDLITARIPFSKLPVHDKHNGYLYRTRVRLKRKTEERVYLALL